MTVDLAPLTSDEMLDVLIAAQMGNNNAMVANQAALNACTNEDQRVAFGHRRNQDRLLRLDGLIARALREQQR